MTHLLKRPGRPSRRLAAAAAGVGLVLGLGVSQSSAEPGKYPPHPDAPGQGLPHPGGLGVSGNWISPQAASANYLSKAKQWTRTTTLQFAAYKPISTSQNDPTCRRITEVPGASSIRRWEATAALVNTTASPDAANRYGESAEFTASTVAFGAIPVEATVALVQPRDDAGVVLPVELRQSTGNFCPGQGPIPTRPAGRPGSANAYREPAEVSGPVAVQVRKLTVDGVDINLAARCESQQTQLELTSERWTRWQPEDTPERYQPVSGSVTPERIYQTELYSVEAGGLLFGDLDIPAFSGCATSTGDDLSNLLTAAVSGPGNRVETRAQGLPDTDEDLGDIDTLPKVCPFTGNCELYFTEPAPFPDGEPEG
ncbi:hypothetical protein [Aeromicrobium piscarium]|uniref:Uncharacterized protein n=1 Tax=Aeromicrobium piscarium TaxID=2590901 RepID=A0A554RX70_9ACTN|nr:hypothetical protein [Aeromicrobium piscarium]TSD58682.1 hypothetical protein FNM00_13565 [Aeromicrobium piscarium]